MPLCHLAIRLLSCRRNLPTHITPRTPVRWHPRPRRCSTASQASPRGDIQSVDPDFDYLDFVLGNERPLQQALQEAEQSRDDNPKASQNEEQGIKPGMDQSPSLAATKRAPTRREKNNHAHQARSGVSFNQSTGTGRKVVLFVGGRKASSAIARSQRAGAPTSRLRVHEGGVGAPLKTIKNQRRLARRLLQMKDVARETRNLLLRHQTSRPTWPRFVSLRSGCRGFNSRWNAKFASISSRYDRGVPPELRTHTSVKLGRAGKVLTKFVLENMRRRTADVFAGSTPDGMPISNGTRLKYWRDVALQLMQRQPHHLLDFLKATHAAPLTPPSLVQDCLQFLAWHYTQSEKPSQEGIDALIEALPSLAKRDDGERLSFEDTFCVDLLPYCDASQVLHLYRTVKDTNIQIKWQAWLHFATRLNKNLQLEEGLDAILQAKNTGVKLESVPFLSNCSTLLRTSIRQPEGFRVCLRIVDNLVAMGLRLTTHLCNVIMLNAVESNDLKTAFDVYTSLKENGLEPDMYTFAILLKGCKLSIDDANVLNSVIRDAIEHVQVLQQPVVATEILHCLAIHHTKHHPDSAFDTVAEAFAQMFDLTPLQRLGVPFPDLPTPGQPAEEKLKPAPQSLHILLKVCLQGLLRRSGSAQAGHEIYKRFHSLVDAKEEPFLSMSREDFIFNLFLDSFVQTRGGLLYAAELIKDMQRNSAKGFACAPTVITWTIFLNGLTRHGQIKLAEQVLNYMAKQGLKPDQVMWNSLVAGYAGQEDVEGTLNVLRRMEADGSVFDEFTMKAVRRATFHQSLMAKVTESQQAARLDFTADIKEGLVRKLSSEDNVEADNDSQTADSPGELAESTNYTPFRD